MAHTPGPWTAYKGQVSATEDRIVAECGPDVTIPKSEAIANARLIAAAPDLLSACEAVADYDIPGHGGGSMAQVRAAIAKAKGGAS